MRLSAYTAVLLLVTLSACNGGETDTDVGTDDTNTSTDDTGTDDTGTDDTGTDDTGTDDTGELPTTFSAKINVSDFATRTAMADVVVKIGDEAFTSDAAGDVQLTVPGGTFEAVASVPNYLDTYWTFVNDDDGFSLGSFLVSRAAADAVAGAAGGPLDTSKGVVVVTAYGPGDPAYTAGATVALDNSYRVALVADSGSPSGFSAGSTTLAGSAGWVVFLDVPAGDVTPTLTLANGEKCLVFPGKDEGVTFTVHADSVNHIHFKCE